MTKTINIDIPVTDMEFKQIGDSRMAFSISLGLNIGGQIEVSAGPADAELIDFVRSSGIASFTRDDADPVKTGGDANPVLFDSVLLPAGDYLVLVSMISATDATVSFDGVALTQDALITDVGNGRLAAYSATVATDKVVEVNYDAAGTSGNWTVAIIRLPVGKSATISGPTAPPASATDQVVVATQTVNNASEYRPTGGTPTTLQSRDIQSNELYWLGYYPAPSGTLTEGTRAASQNAIYAVIA